ncbi:30S ribosomal protein S6 [bacterium]|nr:30S ribosomal protein S6 [bacterium]
MNNNYELLCILNSEIPDEDIETYIDKIKGIIVKEGGEVTNINKWGKRRLAYDIHKYKKGFYLLLQFLCDPQNVKEIGMDLKFVDNLERFMTVAISDKMASSGQEANLEQLEEAI